MNNEQVIILKDLCRKMGQIAEATQSLHRHMEKVSCLTSGTVAVIQHCLTIQEPHLPQDAQQSEKTAARSDLKAALAPAFLDKRAASKFVGLSTRTLDLAKSRGDLPFYRVGSRKVLFSAKDLTTWIARYRVDCMTTD